MDSEWKVNGWLNGRDRTQYPGAGHVGLNGARRLCIAASVESAANAPRPSSVYEGLCLSHEGIVSSSLDWQQRGLCGLFLVCTVGQSLVSPRLLHEVFFLARPGHGHLGHAAPGEAE